MENIVLYIQSREHLRKKQGQLVLESKEGR